MSSRSKVERALHGPSLTEVTLGAVLSVALGGLLAALYLIARPVERVRTLPEEPVAGQVYYVEGSRAGGAQWMNKRKLMMEEGDYDVQLSEAELNSWMARSVVKPEEASAGILKPEAINFRLHDGRLQIGLPGTLDVFGVYSQKLILQTRGGFERAGDQFVYAADEFLIGSLPVHRLPGLTSLILPRLMRTEEVPEELTTAWRRLRDVRVDGEMLVLSLP